MLKHIWEFRLEDGRHNVELKHGFLSGKREIFVDGAQIESFSKSSDAGLHQFQAAGHSCVLKREPEYHLYVDGKHVLALAAYLARGTPKEKTATWQAGDKESDRHDKS